MQPVTAVGRFTCQHW